MHRIRPRALAAAMTLPLLLTQPVLGQVGHDPARSPYRDIRRSTFLIATAGQFLGTGGGAGVAPHSGSVFGLRMGFLANRTIQLGVGVSYGTLERLVYDPLKPPGERFSGPIEANVLWTEGAINFSLTGGKTWRRFAPYVGAATGLAFVEDLEDDPANFRMGTRFFLAPTAGVRWFPADRVMLLAEGRFHFWQVKYTTPFAVENVAASEWIASPWVNLGLAWAFSWPF